jgi:hypothetical protein
MTLLPSLIALLAVLPMLAPLTWQPLPLRLAFDSDVGLGALTPFEQPFTIRTFAGQWGLLLVIAWFGLAYAQRRAPLWELGLMLLGSMVALVRLGNVWLTAVLFVPPLARRLLGAEPWLATILGRGVVVGGLGVGLCVVTLGSLMASRSPDMPAEAARAALIEPDQGPIFSSWRWAAELQRELGPTRRVLGAGALSSEYAMDYLRVSLAHADWDSVLWRYGVGLVVLDAADAQAVAQVRRSSAWQVTLDRDGILVARRVKP